MENNSPYSFTRKVIEDLSVPKGNTRQGIFDPIVHNVQAGSEKELIVWQESGSF